MGMTWVGLFKQLIPRSVCYNCDCLAIGQEGSNCPTAWGQSALPPQAIPDHDEPCAVRGCPAYDPAGPIADMQDRAKVNGRQPADAEHCIRHEGADTNAEVRRRQPSKRAWAFDSGSISVAIPLNTRRRCCRI
ncbi:hypothetical protein FPOAC1_009130 [Fusarium poae]|uniref:hypothetical protein n=1 Tax=Fusarium poae TaxID=36050 RepID=UPI001CE79989|nr:hypothetical protein FPOAC1_009130 [Fusarium poae]KAG8669731.1 hypothetical protein FPOAC1_009130 [Fusarium poae]